MFSSISSIQSLMNYSNNSASAPSVPDASTIFPMYYLGSQPVLFNNCFVVTVNGTLSVSSLYIDNVLKSPTIFAETIQGSSLKWVFLDCRSTCVIGNTYQFKIFLSDGNSYQTNLIDILSTNGYVCYNESSFNNTTKVWTDLTPNGRNKTLSSGCTLSSISSGNNSTGGFNAVYIQGGVANVLFTEAQATAMGNNFSIFSVGRRPDTASHYLANVSTSTNDLVTFGSWSTNWQFLWWKTQGGISATTSDTTFATNWNCYTLYRNSSASNNLTYYINRCNNNLLTTQPATITSFGLGHDCQTGVSAQNGYGIYMSFFCIINANLNNWTARSCEVALYMIYKIQARN